MEHASHLFRAVGILVLGLAGYLLGRPYLVPVSFGTEGFYRYDSIAEHASRPTVHGGPESCEECHIDEYEAWDYGKHRPISCEVCHGPVAPHADKKDKIADMPVHKTPDLCMNCHRKMTARPADFPQVEFLPHLKEAGFQYSGEIPPDACISCHRPHEANK